MKRTIEVSSRGARLSLRNSRILVHLEDTELADIPVEDLGMVILGTTGVSLSSGVLKALAEAGGALLACDDAHNPNGLFLPMDGHSLHSERARLQAEMSAPLRKNLWARIVAAKIGNQASLLTEPTDRDRMLVWSKAVRSDDEGNLESRAARHYWPRVFAEVLPAGTPPFSRHREGPPPNSLLNYGYTVLRAATARHLCAAGLHPAVGLHHRNRYSGFCLADDLMEPFRPYVDREVRHLTAKGVREIDKTTKGALIGVLMSDVQMQGERMVLDHALERAAASLAKAIEQQVKFQEAAPRAAGHLLLPNETPPCR